MSFELKGIKIIHYEYHDLGIQLDLQKIQIAIGRMITRQTQLSPQLLIALRAEAHYFTEGQPPLVLSLLETQFFLNTDELIPALQNANLRESFMDGLHTVAESAYDTIRGMLYLKWMGTPLQFSSIPLVQHGEFLRDYVFPDGFWTNP